MRPVLWLNTLRDSERCAEMHIGSGLTLEVLIQFGEVSFKSQNWAQYTGICVKLNIFYWGYSFVQTSIIPRLTWWTTIMLFFLIHTNFFRTLKVQNFRATSSKCLWNDNLGIRKRCELNVTFPSSVILRDVIL